MFYTEEQLEELKRWEHCFDAAVNGGALKGAAESHLRRIAEIYEQASGMRQPPLNVRCGGCVQNLLYRAGYKYYEDKKEIAERDRRAAQRLADKAVKAAAAAASRSARRVVRTKK